MTDKGEWVDAWVRELHGAKLANGKPDPDAHPLAARVAVLRKDWTEPLYAVATWEEYVQTTSQGRTTSMWLQRGAGQLAKCAEALALRKAFPQDLSGIYTDDEMATAVPLDQVEEGAPEARSRVAQLNAKATRQEAAGAVGDTVTVVEDQDGEKSATSGGGDQPGKVTDARGNTFEEVTVAPGVRAQVLYDGALCSECGLNQVKDEGDICGPCEDRILREEAGDGQG
jgi:hypothetical protein